MITLRKSGDRGHANHGWLDSYHTFSFANYYDPEHMGFRALRVINQDRVDGGAGFGTHGHRDMEIVSYVLEGGLDHRDSMGNGSTILPGDVQRMTAGTGVLHSEFNHSKTDPVRFLQIWIEPGRRGLQPGYEQKLFSRAEKLNQLREIVSPDGRDGSVTIHQDARIFAAILEAGQKVAHQLNENRYAWLQVVRGAIALNGLPLVEGDGAAIAAAGTLTVQASEESELLLFDLA
ncbi:pirin family protein [Synechococcus sp. PCC 7336]|uniref:pirin family protein n=1 Tax=Synechococcus sp. PCC 7336 TaxID=195250 RepID=UPI00034C1B59|nr:pirin family protein [Synechococcus sp. PCC 7336]